jgi:hypothetical protein
MSQIMNPPIVNYIPQAQDYTQDFLAGIKQGQELQAFRKQQELVQKQELFKQDYNVLSQSPSGKGMLDLMIKYPDFATGLKPIQEVYSRAEKEGELSQMMQIDNALRHNNPELAKKLVMQTKTAFENAGKDTKNLDTIIETIDANPDLARGSIGMTLAQLMGDKYETYEKGLTARMTQDANINKAKSEASSAAIDVAEKNIKFKYIEPKLLLDLKKENIDIAKITQDMNLTKQNIILKELEIKLARESHPLKIKELRAKIGKATEEINQSTREKADNYKNTIDTFNNTINTVDKILANPELEKVTGIVEGRLPGFSGLQTDAIADIETLQSQLFLSQVKELKGMGALSDAEGKKLDASISSLDRKQTYEQFKQNLNYIRNTITKGIQKASDKYQMKPRIDRPYLKSDPKKVDEILKKYGVK